jgi:hypothetical protein
MQWSAAAGYLPHKQTANQTINKQQQTQLLKTHKLIQ